MEVSSDVIPLNETFQLIITVENAKVSNLTLPNISKNFITLQGPLRRYSSQNVNGKVSTSESLSYTLKAKSTGQYQFEPSVAIINGKKYQSNRVSFRIVKDNISKATKKTNSKELFISLSPSKSTIYKGEQFYLTYKLFAKVNVSSYDLIKAPAYSGFYTKEIEVDPNRDRNTANVNGINYSVFPIKKIILFPQRSGNQKIDPLKAEFAIEVRSGKPINTFFGPRYNYVQKKIKVNSNILKINVLPLPNGAPESFNNAVGNFNFKCTISKTKLKINESINLNINLKGTGNIEIIDVKTPIFPSDFEIYDPEIKSNFKITNNKVSGSKNWNILLIPRTGGEFEIPKIEFSYFNPNTKKYYTKTAGPFKIVVEKGEENKDELTHTSNHKITKRTVQSIATDIRYLKQDKHLLKKNVYFFTSNLYYTLVFVPIFILILILLIDILHKKNNKNTQQNRRRKANKISKKLLNEARKAIEKNDKTTFYKVTYKALYSYVLNKLNISNIELDIQNIEKELNKKNITKELIHSLVETINLCEMGKFSPIEVSMHELYKRSTKIIIELEQTLK